MLLAGLCQRRPGLVRLAEPELHGREELTGLDFGIPRQEARMQLGDRLGESAVT